MKTTKKTTAKSTKNTKTVKTKLPEILVNAVNIETAEDFRYEMTLAKVRAGVPIAKEELEDFEQIVIEDTMDMCNTIEYLVEVIDRAIDTFVEANTPKEETKKVPWYKRLFKWLFRK